MRWGRTALAVLPTATLLSGAPDAGHAAHPKLGPAQLSELGARTLDQCAAREREVAELEAALDRVLQNGSQGSTGFAAGMRAAQQQLLQAGADPGPRRAVLFMSDWGTPVVEAGGDLRREDPAVGDAIREAAAVGVVFHTLALGADAAAHPADLEEIATGTGGAFHPVTDLTRLHCQLAAALLP